MMTEDTHEEGSNPTLPTADMTAQIHVGSNLGEVGNPVSITSFEDNEDFLPDELMIQSLTLTGNDRTLFATTCTGMVLKLSELRSDGKPTIEVLHDPNANRAERLENLRKDEAMRVQKAAEAQNYEANEAAIEAERQATVGNSDLGKQLEAEREAMNMEFEEKLQDRVEVIERDFDERLRIGVENAAKNLKAEMETQIQETVTAQEQKFEDRVAKAAGAQVEAAMDAAFEARVNEAVQAKLAEAAAEAETPPSDEQKQTKASKKSEKEPKETP